MEFSLSPVDSGEVRMLKQCRPILELGDDREEHSRSMKLSRTDSFSSAGRQQESNSSPSPDDHHSSPTTLLGATTDPHASGGMLYQQQYSSRPLFQQQQGSYNSPYSIKQFSSTSSPGSGFQQQQLHYFPFTASQWAELEHQALIFKYMMARAPVPPELVIPIRRSLILAPSTTNSWSGFQLGVGSGSPMDAEPGRCRRTDGKKWRCSRPVVADQKYCERHMHRGRNRSRKAAEAAAAAAAAGTAGNSATTAATTTTASATNNGGAKSSVLSGSGNKGGSMAVMETGMGSYHYPVQSPHGDLASKDQRFVNGMSKAGFDPLRPEQLLFAEVSGSCTRTLGGSSTSSSSHQSSSRLLHHHDIGSMQIFGSSSTPQEQVLHQHHHLSTKNPLIRGIERKPEALRHFFDDDWPRVEDAAATSFKTAPPSSTGILSLALEEDQDDRDASRHHQLKHRNDRSSQDEDEQEEAYTHISLATSGGSGDLLSELLLKSPSSCKPPPPSNATKMILSSPTGVLQKLTCFSDSSSSASSPGSVKNDASHAQ